MSSLVIRYVVRYEFPERSIRILIAKRSDVLLLIFTQHLYSLFDGNCAGDRNRDETGATLKQYSIS